MDAPSPPTIASTIAAEIGRAGPMRFDRYMEIALYAPGGFYDRPPVGAAATSDFVTSPHVHPIFAQLVADALGELLDAMGGPEPCDLIEVGAGDGTLIRAVMAHLADRHVRVIAVERSAGARAALDRVEGLEVHELLPAPAAGPALVLAHELLDNLGFRRLRATPEGLREVHVDVEGERFVEVLAPVGDGLEPLRPLGPDQEAIVPTGAMSFVHEALDGPAPRALLAIDYGSDGGAGGPAHGYAGHRVVGDLLATPGTTDITAGVDFGAVAQAARARGYRTFPTVGQHDALVALGLETWLSTELERQRDQLNTARGAAAVGTWGGRSRATMLADPGGLGRFRWFVAATPSVTEPAWLRAALGRRSAGEP